VDGIVAVDLVAVLAVGRVSAAVGTERPADSDWLGPWILGGVVLLVVGSFLGERWWRARQERRLMATVGREGWTVHVGEPGPLAEGVEWRGLKTQLVMAVSGDHRGRPAEVLYLWWTAGDGLPTRRSVVMVGLDRPHPGLVLSRRRPRESGSADLATPPMRRLLAYRSGGGLRSRAPLLMRIDSDRMWLDIERWPLAGELDDLLDQLDAATPT
jgi:hypothetical protein